MTKYSQQLLNYFYHLEHAGSLCGGGHIFIHEEGCAPDGEVIKLYLNIENDKIIAARFKSFGSVALIASGEYICRWLEHKSCCEAAKIMPDDVLQALGLSKLYNHTAVLVVQCVKGLLARDE